MNMTASIKSGKDKNDNAEIYEKNWWQTGEEY